MSPPGVGFTHSMPWRSAAGSSINEKRLLSMTAETLLAVDGDQIAAAAVGPGVEGATEARPLAVAVRHHLGAAVAAGVGEGVELAVLVARHQDGQPRLAVCPIGAGLRQIAGEAHEERRLAKEDAALFGQEVRTGEVGERAADDALAVDFAAALIEPGFENAQ